MSCSENDLKKLISHRKNNHEDGFFKKYEKIVEIINVSLQNSAIKVLMHFGTPSTNALLLGM
jgi:hypothetical protein